MDKHPFDAWWDERQAKGVWNNPLSDRTAVGSDHALVLMRATARRAWLAQQEMVDDLVAAAKSLLAGLEHDGLAAGMGSLVTDLEAALAKAEGN